MDERARRSEGSTTVEGQGKLKLGRSDLLGIVRLNSMPLAFLFLVLRELVLSSELSLMNGFKDGGTR